jgi:acyl-CoA synthetase (AMP-forming)/AMP-acid ligase II
MQLIETFDRGVEMNPDGLCFTTPDGAEQMTYAQASALSHRIAAGLAEAGVVQETKIAVLSPNDAVAFCCVLGGLRLNASWVPLNTRSTTPDLVHVLELSDCEHLFFHPSLAHVR